jgi:type II secretory pathway predicted ATPase ExeA
MMAGGSRQQLSAEFSRSDHEIACVHDTRDPTRFVLTARHAAIAALVEGVMQGEPLLALTGPPGIGKSIVASAIRDELIARSVRVLEVHRGDGDGISLQTIASQLLGKPEAGLNDDDIERLFDVLTAREEPEQTFALIVDDAECLQADAIGYLRLLTILAKDAMPRIVFVGRPAFWDTEYAADSRMKELITAHWELPGLDPEETHDFISQTVALTCPGVDDAFAPGGYEALARHGDGLCGRIVSLLSVAETLRSEGGDHWLTPALIDDAAARLDAGEAASCETADVPAETSAEPADAEASDDGSITEHPSRGMGRKVLMVAVAIVSFSIFVATPSQSLVHIGQPETTAPTLDPRGAAVPAKTDVAEAASPRMPAAADPVAARIDPTPPVVPSPPPAVAPVVVAESPLPADVPIANSPAPAVGAADPSAAAEDIQPAPTAGATPAQAPPDGSTANSAAPVVGTTDPSTAAAVAPPPPPVPTEQPHPQEATTPAAEDAPAITVPAPPAPTAQPQTQEATAPAVQDAPAEASDGATHAPAAAEPPRPAAAVERGEPAKPAPFVVVSPPSAPVDLRLLLSRGDTMLALGDMSAARLLYQRAAAAGSARAATAIGKTYDPAFLASIHASGVAPDRDLAAVWYRKGAALGDREGADRLAGLTAAR